MSVLNLPNIIIDYTPEGYGAVYIETPSQVLEHPTELQLVAKMFNHRRSYTLYPFGEGLKTIYKRRRKSMTDIDLILRKIPQTKFLMKHLETMKITQTEGFGSLRIIPVPANKAHVDGPTSRAK